MLRAKNTMNRTFPRLGHVKFLALDRQWRISDQAFRHVTNLQSLEMWGCHQRRITDEAFRHLSNLTSLDMIWCDQTTITDEPFCHLTNLHSVNVRTCVQTTITASSFSASKKTIVAEYGGVQTKNDYRYGPNF